MAEIVGVRFKDVGKVHYFLPNNQKVKINDLVIVETAAGSDCGRVVIIKKNFADKQVLKSLTKVLRKAEFKDFERLKRLKEKEARAAKICGEKIKKHRLNMKLIGVEYTFDGHKIVFYFTAEARVDFRNLVKELASIFKARIELRQVGVRNEAKSLGGLGICGKPFCCSTFLDEFQPVSIKMAKEQGLSLNPVKISGTCGRLMCCLKFEQAAYQDLLKKAPKPGAIVDTLKGRGTVVEQNLLTGVLKIRMDSAPEAAPVCYNLRDVKIVKDAEIKVNKKELDELKNLE